MGIPESMELSDSEQELWTKLHTLGKKFRQSSWQQYQRINPFQEELFDWEEKGEFLDGTEITIYESATIIEDVTIGDNSWIGPFTILDGSGGGLEIGSYCSVSSGVHIYTHESIKWALSGGKEDYSHAPVSVGDQCHLGPLSIITPGVQIGSQSVVGANAVVTQNVPSKTIVGGVPAKEIGTVSEDSSGNIQLNFDESEEESYASP